MALSSLPAGNTLSFSSSPGFLSSKDDFLFTNQGLLIMETTNSILNTTIYSELSSSTVFTWIRSMVVSRLAKTPEDWAHLFEKENSGTYNNQWMILDLALFGRHVQANPSSTSLPAGLLYIVEQIPGYTQTADVTSVLESQTYWPSYNIPYFPEVFERSGYPSFVDKKGSEYTYGNCSRAKIFNREQQKVSTERDFERVLQYNDYVHDEFSAGDPARSISSRYDLRGEGRAVAFGGIDSKVFSYERWHLNKPARGICGPTHQGLPPFSFLPKFDSKPHLGLPDVFNFPWIEL